MNLLVVLIGLLLFFLYKKGPAGMKLPSWIATSIGIFLLFMLLRNISDAFDFLVNESDHWWPLIKENAQNLSAGFRELLRKIMNEGG
ncbi:hypothetical protein J1TS5_10100 [Paenibacillus macerans]|uniref:hypothetical protein n=1 Tax=Paenibacillus macerans TaxID=44252 RepID=UPI001B2A6D27|nr:hypothetical protein [Paenibacillus macerans]GIP08840.1 hypothetical protein J1TS5_10100 [Paenibacillus macerans]